jgi:hypothetical protein
MSKLKFDKGKIENVIKKIFPKSHIDKYEKFPTGLVSSTFKIKLSNPPRILAVKLSKLKKEG